jgi:hypothetical protein
MGSTASQHSLGDQPKRTSSPLGILAGNGRLPMHIVDSCREKGRAVFVLVFGKEEDAQPFQEMPHAAVRIGAVGEAIAQLKNAGVKELIMAGGVRRPSLSALKPDLVGAKLLARLGTAFFAGDDALLRMLIQFLEEEGFTVLGVKDVLTECLAAEGVIGEHMPTEAQRRDIVMGVLAAQALGARDIGQAVVVKNQKVVGREGAEGTDALLASLPRDCGNESVAGVLVKMKKPKQDDRADLPSIGPDTVTRAHAAGLAGIAVEANNALILDRATTIALANAHGMFLYGVTPEGYE